MEVIEEIFAKYVQAQCRYTQGNTNVTRHIPTNTIKKDTLKKVLMAKKKLKKKQPCFTICHTHKNY